jgi:hypothetical protein
VIGAPRVLGNIGPGQLYFDPTVYRTPDATLTSPSGVAYAPFGILTRNGSGLTGPGYFNLDATIFKKFKFTERVGGELRADMFNALNHPNFNNPATNLTSATVGQINGTSSSPRLIRFGVRVSF